VDHFLVGYTESPVTFNVDWDDVSLGITSSWEDIDVTAETSASANGVFIYHLASAGWHDTYIRENGSTDDRTANGLLFVDTFEFGGCGLDGDNIFEGWIENVACDFFVVGYTEVGTIYPVNEDVSATSEFAINQTIGWINVSVSHANGYGNITSIMASVNTTGYEVCNVTWTQSTGAFEVTYDPNSMIKLNDLTSVSTLSGTWSNISFNVAFLSGTAGDCNITVLSTAIDSETDYDIFQDEFFLSDFQRATGITWTKDYGNFYDMEWDVVDISENGNRTVYNESYTNILRITDGEGTELWNWNYGENTSYGMQSAVVSGDGNYVFWCGNIGVSTTLNVTLFDADDGTIIWSYAYASETYQDDPAINYNGSLIAVGTADEMFLFDVDGFVWRTSTVQGLPIGQLTGASVSRDGNLIASGTQITANFPNGSLLVWTKEYSEPRWQYELPVIPFTSVHNIRSTQISDDGLYIGWAYCPAQYGTSYGIHGYASSTPLNVTDTYNGIASHSKISFVAESGKDEFYFVGSGDYTLTASRIQVHKYNVTSDIWTSVWNYTSDLYNVRWNTMSSVMKNDRYYFATCGDEGVHYFDTTSNETIWTYTNATHDINYRIAMDLDGNNFFSSALHIGDKEKYSQYYGYVPDIPFQVEEATITNMEGCGAWIFADERFYNFQGEFSHVIDATSLSHVGLRISDELNTFYLWYNISARSNDVEAFSLEISPQFDADKSPGTIDEVGSSATFDEGDLTVTWKFWPTMFSFDAQDIDIYAYVNDTLGNEIDWTIESSDYFNLYVLGGFTNSSSVGDAGQYQQRNVFDIYAGDDSSVLVEVYYRKLQSVHLNYKIWIPDAYIDYDQNWSLDLGIDYCFYGDDNWYKGWKTQVQTFGGSEIATGNNKWINYTVEHYRYNPTSVDYEPMRQGKMYAYWEGYNTGRDYFQLYTDLWFSTSNRSRMWGARVNSVYFGMKNNALFGLGWLFGNNWRAMKGNFTDLAYKDMIMDYSGASWGDVRYTSEIVMCRFWMNLTRFDTGFAYYVRVQDYTSQEFNRLQIGQFEGVDDPPLIETAVPYMGDQGGGLFGNFFAWLMETASIIVEGLTIGLMAGVGVFVGFLDTLFGLAGWEGGASTIVSWITTLVNFIISAFTYLFDILTSLFGIMATWLVLGIQRFISLGSGLVIIYNNLSWIYTEASSGWVDVSEIIVPMLPLLPLAYFIWLLNSDNAEGVFRKLKMSWDFVRSIAGFFIQIGQYTLQLISSIIEAIQW